LHSKFGNFAPPKPPPFLGPKNEEERETKKKSGERRREWRVNPLLTWLVDSLMAAENLY